VERHAGQLERLEAGRQRQQRLDPPPVDAGRVEADAQRPQAAERRQRRQRARPPHGAEPQRRQPRRERGGGGGGQRAGLWRERQRGDAAQRGERRERGARVVLGGRRGVALQVDV
jgi:hypothetical protein